MSEASFPHLPVMVHDVVDLFASVPPGVVVDATVGGGGHAEALLSAHPHLRVLGLDRDPDAVAAASRRLAPFVERAQVRLSPFDRLADVMIDLGHHHASGVLFDLGVSSPQLDRAERGFSYRREGPLDMRMAGPGAGGPTAADVVNATPEADLAGLIAELGGERFAARIARAIVAARPLASTTELAAVVRDAIPAPARRRGGHPATRTFQALRIAVNRELELLPGALDAAIGVLATGGRCLALAYHSGEDRIVKSRFRHAVTGGCTCPPALPCACGARPVARRIRNGTRTPSAGEQESNPRSSSARLRAIEKIDHPPSPRGAP
ncbi:MAG TPA: 16S rRNA (cytosine(1402)-N(4))-methyltransferase RsmH [Acidimicrobiales bacterium]|nr:16S rRNA (cytosine(1402)-N(4))-methyltransferase RsmH [Acidimicrobiales bacterium]